MLLDMQGQDAVYSWINKGKEPKMPMYELTEEEFETIQAIRKGEAGVVMFPKKRTDVNVGDIDEYDCQVISIRPDGGFMISSRREPEEIEAALKKGAKRVVLD